MDRDVILNEMVKELGYRDEHVLYHASKAMYRHFLNPEIQNINEVLVGTVKVDAENVFLINLYVKDFVNYFGVLPINSLNLTESEFYEFVMKSLYNEVQEINEFKDVSKLN